LTGDDKDIPLRALAARYWIAFYVTSTDANSRSKQTSPAPALQGNRALPGPPSASLFCSIIDEALIDVQ